MPPLLHARPAADPAEQHTIRKLAASRHAPADQILRARIVARSCDGQRPRQIAAELGGHPQTVRQWLHRFNAHGVDGLGDRPRSDGQADSTRPSVASSSLWSAGHCPWGG